tara:strand:- start:1421 stop:3052 length:1632 start_codon:yes stop_codon:yes gene_type:complete
MHWGYLLASTLVTIIFLTWTLLDLFWADTPDLPGTRTISDITNLGFGSDRKLLVVDFDVATIDMSDKKWARMEVYQTINGTVEQSFYPVGIEIKGSGISERPKSNYAIGIWEDLNENITCTSIDTCDDGKQNLFGMFSDEFEDWVMRGGYKEPTLLRDALPSQMDGGILEHALVELVFRNEGKYFYEGVYILYPAIQRKVLEKRLNWSNKGKKPDCEDNVTSSDIAETAIIGEYTNSGWGSRKKTCAALDNMVKLRYPKCDDITCYVDDVKAVFDVLTLVNKTVVSINLTSFAKNFLAESLMLNGDFPLSSQYFYKNPDDGVLYAGPRWDYDFMSWRAMGTDSWDQITNYRSNHMPLWQKLGNNAEFIALLESIRVATTTLNYDVVKSTIAERKAQFQAGYFDRNIARWGGFGNRVVPFTQDFNIVNSRVEKTFLEEVSFQEEKFKARAAWMLSHPVLSFEFKYDATFAVRTLFTLVPFIMFFLALLVWIVVLVLFSVDGGCDCGDCRDDEDDGDDADDMETKQMLKDYGFGLKTLEMNDFKF